MLTDYNNKFLSRIYPKAVRFDSSNFDPILFWYAGCQMVALNIQTDSYPMWVNGAKFRENGQSGYVLRRFNFIASNTFGGAASLGKSRDPEVVQQEKFSRPISSYSELTVELFGGRLFPPNTGPIFFQVQLFDGSPNVLKFKTEPVSNLFMADVADFECKIPIQDSSNSYLAISAWAGKEVVGHWCGAVEMLRQGYRVCEMLDRDNKPIAKGQCHVLCRFELKK